MNSRSKLTKKKNILHWMIWSYQGCENYRTLNVFIFFSSNEWTCNLLRKAFDNTRGQKKTKQNLHSWMIVGKEVTCLKKDERKSMYFQCQKQCFHSMFLCFNCRSFEIQHVKGQVFSQSGDLFGCSSFIDLVVIFSVFIILFFALQHFYFLVLFSIIFPSQHILMH